MLNPIDIFTFRITLLMNWQIIQEKRKKKTTSNLKVLENDNNNKKMPSFSWRNVTYVDDEKEKDTQKLSHRKLCMRIIES